jgi:hypothetical protein
MSGAATPLATLPARLAVLRFTRLQLALPLGELVSLEPVLDVDFDDRQVPSIGSLRAAQEQCRVFALSDALEVQGEAPQDHRICAVVDLGSERVALTCRAVATVETGAISAFPLPQCMRTAVSPVRGLLEADGEVLCWTDAAGLARILLSPVRAPLGGGAHRQGLDAQ